VLTQLSHPVRWLAREAGLRFLSRRKAATIVAAITMALALGANTAAFAILKAFLFSSFAVPAPDRLFVVAPVRALEGRGNVIFADAYPNYLLLRGTQRSFSEVSAVTQGVASWDDGREVRPLQAGRVTASFFRTMRVSPLLGRTFASEDEGTHPTPVVVIGHALWQAAMSGDPGVIGRAMTINGAPHTIIGVMPAGFTHPLPTEIWLPLSLTQRQMTSITGARSLTMYGRLRDGLPRAAVDAEMAAFTTRALEASADNKDYSYELHDIREFFIPGVGRTVLLVQCGALILVLLAVINLASLLIAWGFDRQGETAVRLALGAKRGLVLRAMVVQSVVLVLVGAIGGLLLAKLALAGISQLNVGQALSIFLANLRLDVAVGCWTLGVALVAGVVAGAVPQWVNRGIGLATALRTSTRSASLSPQAMRWQKGIVGLQAALTVVILAGGMLIALSFRNLRGVAAGYTAGQRMVARIQLGGPTYTDHAARAAFAVRLMDAFSREAELATYGFTSTLPVGDNTTGGRFFPEASDGSLSAEPLLFHYRRVSSNYLATIGIPLLKGRPFEDRDDAAHPAVAIVSRALAARVWPNQDAIGKRLMRVVPGGAPEPITVVGVASDVHDAGNAAPAGETIYVPFAQLSVPQMSVVATSKTTGDAAIAAVRRALRKADPVLTVSGVAKLSAVMEQGDALPRLRTILGTAFGVVALAIAMLGSYGVMSQLVANREREFALRKVFGAAPRGLGSAVLLQSWRLAVPGVAVGTVAVWLLSAVLRPFVFGVDPRSWPLTLGVALGVLVMVAVAAVAPAVRAARVDVRRGVAG